MLVATLGFASGWNESMLCTLVTALASAVTSEIVKSGLRGRPRNA